MKLKCPTCGTPIPVSHINVQALTAVCSECGNVFSFQTSTMPSRRKIKPPEQVRFYEDALLHFKFKWDWRTEPLVGLILIGMALIAFAAMLVMGGNSELLMALLLMLIPAYALVGVSVNATHYQISDDKLYVFTRPLWFPAYGHKTILLDEIDQVTAKRIIDTPTISQMDTFYNVFVHHDSGQQIMIARLVNSQHAHFIVQELQVMLDSRRQADDNFIQAGLILDEADPWQDVQDNMWHEANNSVGKVNE